MRRTPLYSRSTRTRGPGGARAAGTGFVALEAAPEPAAPQGPGVWTRLGRWMGRHASRPAVMWSALGLLACAWLVTLWLHQRDVRQELTQKDIDAAVLHSLQNQPLPSAAAKAYDTIAPSVVRVVGLMSEHDDYKPERPAPRDPGGATSPQPAVPGGAASAPRAPDAAVPPEHGASGNGRPAPQPQVPPPEDDLPQRGQGTGVVIVDTGVILTNLHVVHGARRLKVEFHTGLVADADVVGLHPEHDLAVLKARQIPDELPAATMRSTAGLKPGDHVLAVGFPFGIGPSASSGIVSGLRREFRSREGERLLTNLIQFDAAANPGNSGGPLVTDEGEVVGIVTAILNPSEQRTFIGIGFAVPIENAAAAVGIPPF